MQVGLVTLNLTLHTTPQQQRSTLCSRFTQPSLCSYLRHTRMDLPLHTCRPHWMTAAAWQPMSTCLHSSSSSRFERVLQARYGDTPSAYCSRSRTFFSAVGNSRSCRMSCNRQPCHRPKDRARGYYKVVIKRKTKKRCDEQVYSLMMSRPVRPALTARPAVGYATSTQHAHTELQGHMIAPNHTKRLWQQVY
jgi:hypothetical protein